ncbi:MAG: hypothetical protein ACXVGA_00975 [Mycobacteriaceae bacterium]
MADNTIVLVAPSGAQTTSGNSGLLRGPVGQYLNIQINVTAVSGTTPSCAFKVQWSQDAVNWADADPVDAFTAVTATGNVVKNFMAKADFFRLVWTITGTTPSFTFSATAVASSDDPN